MTESASRSRLLELRGELSTAREGRSLLDRKREAILRALDARVARLEELRASVAGELAAARGWLIDAQLQLGRLALDAAALAQRCRPVVRIEDTTVVGVALPTVTMSSAPYVPRYGPCSGSETLDRAGRAFAMAIPDLLRLACAEAAVDRLRNALTRTVRRLNALDTVVVPQLVHKIRLVTSALEEDERDDAVRRARWRDQAEARM